MASRGDFHTHSTASDGRFSPTEIVDLAAGQGVRYHALTDHDSTEGIAEARKAASKHSDYTLIPGVEMGTDIEGAEVHMLGLYLFPEASAYFAPLMVTLGVIGIIYGAIVATMQKDLKRLVAYSSVAHLGFIVLGTFALTTQGLQGGLIQMVNHGISTGALFLLVGMIYERRHTRAIAELRGLQKPAPVMAAVFTVVMLSSIGLPGLNGFVGEFLVLIGTFVSRRWWAVVAATGVILAALYLLWAYQRVFHGEPDEANADFKEMTWREGAVLAPLLALIVFLGVYPKPVLDRMEPSVDRLLTHVEEHTDYRQPGVTQAARP